MCQFREIILILSYSYIVYVMLCEHVCVFWGVYVCMKGLCHT